jgi:hypothetical protein
MLRSVLASRAIVQEGEWTMTKTQWGPRGTARPGAGQRRYVVINQEIDALRTRDLRLFKA